MASGGNGRRHPRRTSAMNIVNLLGRIAKTPETRTAGTTTITTLIVATDRVKLNNEGKSYKDPETGYTAKKPNSTRSPSSTASARPSPATRTRAT
ncbi:hypothetical protein GCM10020258_51850 [Sphingomonas yabuuchiae]